MDLGSLNRRYSVRREWLGSTLLATRREARRMLACGGSLTTVAQKIKDPEMKSALCERGLIDFRALEAMSSHEIDETPFP